MTETELLNESQRAANIGISIHLKKFDDELKVYELSLEDLLSLSGELKELFTVFQDKLSGDVAEAEDGLAALVVVISDPHTMKALRTIAAGSTRRNPDEFKDMGASDWMKWAVAFKAVNDFDELRKLFFQLVPKGAMSQMLGNETSSSASSTDSEPSTAGLPKRS